MTHVLWRGSWTTRVRIVTGLILMIYVTLHVLNIAVVLISPEAFDGFQRVRLWVVRSDIGTVVINAALLAHMGLALGKVVVARTWRMPIGEALQVVLGLLIPLMLVDHLIYTRGAHEMLGVNTMLGLRGPTDLGHHGWLDPSGTARHCMGPSGCICGCV